MNGRRLLGGLLVSASVMAFAAAPAGSARAQGAFDGAWDVKVDCAATPGVSGYRIGFPAQVTGGKFSGTYKPGEAAATATLSGPIAPDGSAQLTMQGTTGPQNLTSNRAAAGTPYYYYVSAKFTPTKGEGQRVGGRPCTFAFARK